MRFGVLVTSPYPVDVDPVRLHEHIRQQATVASANNFDELKRERLIVGSPEEVADQVLSYHHELGVEFMWFTVYWPGMDPAWSLETIQLFGERVIPAIRNAMPASPIL